MKGYKDIFVVVVFLEGFVLEGFESIFEYICLLKFFWNLVCWFLGILFFNKKFDLFLLLLFFCYL